jgi:hypothetical protein
MGAFGCAVFSTEPFFETAAAVLGPAPGWPTLICSGRNAWRLPDQDRLKKFVAEPSIKVGSNLLAFKEFARVGLA